MLRREILHQLTDQWKLSLLWMQYSEWMRSHQVFLRTGDFDHLEGDDTTSISRSNRFLLNSPYPRATWREKITIVSISMHELKSVYSTFSLRQPLSWSRMLATCNICSTNWCKYRATCNLVHLTGHIDASRQLCFMKYKKKPLEQETFQSHSSYVSLMNDESTDEKKHTEWVKHQLSMRVRGQEEVILRRHRWSPAWLYLSGEKRKQKIKWILTVAARRRLRW